MPFQIQQQESLEHALRRIAREQLAIVLCDLEDDAVSTHHKIHSVRARCKKIRGLLRLPGPVMGAAFATEDRRYRDAARQLASHRDEAVYASRVASLGGSADTEPAPPSESAEAIVAEAHQAMTDCLQAVDSWSLDVTTFADIAPGFSRTYRTAVEWGNAAVRDPVDENFHRLRKWIKYHWYQVRILEGVNKPRLKKRRALLRRLQLILGEAHDLVLLEARLASGDHNGSRVLDRATARKTALYAEAKVVAGRVLAKNVDALVADLARWWVKRP